MIQFDSQAESIFLNSITFTALSLINSNAELQTVQYQLL